MPSIRPASSRRTLCFCASGIFWLLHTGCARDPSSGAPDLFAATPDLSFPVVPDASPHSDAAPSPAAPAQACEDYAAAYCRALDGCASFWLASIYGDVATCQTRVALECLTTLVAPGTSRTTAALAACSAALPFVSCGDFFTGVAACAIVPGALSDGAGCIDSNQCRGGWCDLDAPGTQPLCGQCRGAPSIGYTCSHDCGTSGLSCWRGQCVRYGTVGSLCDDLLGAPCAPNLLCNPASCACKHGACATPSGIGAPCDPMVDLCDGLRGLSCDSSTRVCTAADSFATPGQPCGTIGPGVVFCAGGATCSLSTGTCLASAADGAACDPAQGPRCLAPAECTETGCRLPDATACH